MGKSKPLTQSILKGLILGVALSLSLIDGRAQSKEEKPTSEPVRLRLVDGSLMTVDDAWESPQGIWYRQGGISHLASKDKVKSIDHGIPIVTAKRKSDPEPLRMRPVTPPPAPAAPESEADNNMSDKPAWIYLVGGAKVEADSATESTAGVWYKRGSMSIFIEHSRVDHVEREIALVGDSKKERGWSTGSQNLDRLIRQNGTKYSVDPYLIFLVMEQESHFNPRVVSPKGARGLMQLMPGTSARFGVRHPHDPAQNISGGTRYLKQLLDRFDNRVDLVLASYNAGEGAVMKFGQRVPPYRETRNYVKQISYRYQREPKKSVPKSASAKATGQR